MNQRIATAILQRRRLRFTYNGRQRLVEPQCYGIGTHGTELLRVHQLRGGFAREPLFQVAKIEGLEVLDETFSRPGPNYRKDDSAMQIIFCQLEAEPEPAAAPATGPGAAPPSHRSG